MSVFHVPSVCANANAPVVGAIERLCEHLGAFHTRPLAGEDFERVERELHERFVEAEREVLGQLLESLDVDMPSVELGGRRCHRVLRSTETYTTAVGTVRAKRTLYRCGRERAVVPMELRAGIVEGHWTALAARQASSVVAQMTPSEGEALLRELGNMAPSKSSLDRLPKGLSVRWEANREAFESTLREATMHLIERSASMFPAWLHGDGVENEGDIARRANLSGTAQRYLDRLGASVENLFHHVLATLHDPVYRETNAGALKMEWPRIPLPGWPDGETEGVAEALAESAARGRELARLLDSDAPVPGITQGVLRPEMAAIAVPATVDNRNMSGNDFSVTVGWGHYGSADAVMPGQGRVDERAYAPDERVAMGDALSTLGETTFDIYLNTRAFWRSVPSAVWNYKLGGYQVLKKWLSYRERSILDRPLLPEEVQHFTDTARRIGAILMAVRPSRS